MIKVSVIIPAYNAMAFLPSTLESVLHQTFDDFEVIIVNDGSSDKIEDWISKIVKDPRVKLISQENQGLAGARNTGLINAQGEYIAFLDADDIWDRTKLEKQVRTLEENPEVGLVYNWVKLMDDIGQLKAITRANEVEGEVWEKLLEHNIVECGSVAMVRRICYEEVGFFDQSLPSSYGEDWDMWLRIAVLYPFKCIRESLVYYRDHPSSLSKNWMAMEQSYRIIIEKAFQSAPENRQYLKGCCYGFANLRIAWKILQNPARDYRQIMHFWRNAIRHYPKICYSQECIRLTIAIGLVGLLGFDGYSKVQHFTHVLMQRTLDASSCLTASLKQGFFCANSKQVIVDGCTHLPERCVQRPSSLCK